MDTIDRQAWCLVRACWTCGHNLEGVLVCGIDNTDHNADDCCNKWQRCGYLVEMCTGPNACEACEAHKFWKDLPT